MLVATTLLPLNGHRCLESFFQVGNNIAVKGSTYQNEPRGSRTLIPTFRNEIIKIDKLVDVNSRKIIGFLYFLVTVNGLSRDAPQRTLTPVVFFKYSWTNIGRRIRRSPNLRRYSRPADF